MSFIDAIKNAGKKLGIGSDAPPKQDPQQLAQTAGKAITANMHEQVPESKAAFASFEASTGTAVLTGEVETQEVCDKASATCRNVDGVAKVDINKLVIKNPGTPAQKYTVKKGDSLSKIAKEFLGDANKYMRIFEANKHMLKDPDAIYPGQELIIPAKPTGSA